ncbi:MAG: NADH-quinone oxidoreductase subunit L [Conexivisphaerales archaeon]
MNQLLVFFPWLIWLLPLASVPFAPLAAKAGHKAVWLYSIIVSLSSLFFSAISAYTFRSASSSEIAEWVSLLSVPLEITVDGLSLLVSLLVSFLVLLVIIYSLSYIKNGYARYYSLILLFSGSMLGLVMAGNLIQFYFFWEFVGICSALLIAFWSDKEAARKAGMKAFIVTRIGDASLLVAIFFAYSLLGITSFSGILDGFTKQPHSYLQIFGILVLVGAMGKSAQVPLHGWLPDAMEGPTTVSALIHAATMVNAGVYLIVRLSPLYESSILLSYIVITVGVLSSFIGGLAALGADDIKRVLAYSTISQLGIMFTSVGMGVASLAVYHLVSQGLFKALGFLSAGAVIESVGTRNMNQMGGLWRKMKFTYVGFLLSVLAMSGMPPLVGFWSKESIVLASERSALYYLLLISSVLTSVYSFRALFKTFHGVANTTSQASDPHPSMTLPIVILSLSVIFGWVFLSSQQLVHFISFLPYTAYYTSFATIALGFIPSWLAYQIYSAKTGQIVFSSPLAKGLKQFLLKGLGFDTAYEFFAAAFNSFSKFAASIQTGKLQYNVALIFGTLVILLLLGAVGLL